MQQIITNRHEVMNSANRTLGFLTRSNLSNRNNQINSTRGRETMKFIKLDKACTPIKKRKTEQKRSMYKPVLGFEFLSLLEKSEVGIFREGFWRERRKKERRKSKS